MRSASTLTRTLTRFHPYSLFLVWLLYKVYVKEVYREDKIKEWDPVDPSELEHFLHIIVTQGKEQEHRTNSHVKSNVSLELYIHGYV